MKDPLSLSLFLDRGKRVSLQTQLALFLKQLIHDGTLRPGKAAPSSRELARDLQVSRNTVLQAYERLLGEGYLESSPRSGLYVSESLKQTRLPQGGPEVASNTWGRFYEHDWNGLRPPLPFRPCQPDVRLFPLELWNRVRSRALRRHGTNILHYQSHSPLGLAELRRSLASYLQASRGVRCDWRQIAITTGSQQALFLLAHLLLKPEDTVAMEDPGYPGARLAWQTVRARIEPVPVDAAGMKLDTQRNFSPKVIYTTPSRQYPTGSCLSLARRLELVEFSSIKKTWIIEDDYDSEFRYSRAPLPSLQSLDSTRRVVYVGSTSKALFPALRIGYAVLPECLVEKFAELRAAVDEHGPLIDQATLAEFIESGAFFRHIRRTRREYALRLAAFLDSASKFDLPLQFPFTDGGMNVAGFLRSSDGDAKLSERLKKEGLEAPPLSRYSLRTTSPGLLFGFTAFAPKIIGKSLQRVSEVLTCGC